jgi:hypothetical protein
VQPFWNGKNVTAQKKFVQKHLSKFGGLMVFNAPYVDLKMLTILRHRNLIRSSKNGQFVNGLSIQSIVPQISWELNSPNADGSMKVFPRSFNQKLIHFLIIIFFAKPLPN